MMVRSAGARPGRILMTLDAVGGVWRFAMNAAVGLKAHGIETVFAGLGPAPNATQSREAEEIGDLVWLDSPLDWMTENEPELDGLGPALAGLVREYGIDLVHLNVPSQAAGLQVPCPVVAMSHSCVVSWFRAVRGAEVPPEWDWQWRRNRAGFDAADLVLAPSRSHAELLEQCYGPILALDVVFNAVDGGGSPLSKQDFVFAAGRWWDEGKNGAVLDAAVPRVAWPVMMAGSLQGPNGQRLEVKHAAALGERPNRHVRDMMGRAGIVVSPSLYEPFGLAALEAARAGAALVLADIPTYRELWDGAALFADPRSPEAMAGAISRFVEDIDFRGEFARRAAMRAERFSISAQASGLVEAYSVAAELWAPPLAASV